MSVEQVRAAFQRWYALAEQGADLVAAFEDASSPDCLIHSQNGDVGTRATVRGQIDQVRQTFPDLDLEIEHLTMASDRLVAQFTMTGTPAMQFRTPRPQGHFTRPERWSCG